MVIERKLRWGFALIAMLVVSAISMQQAIARGGRGGGGHHGGGHHGGAHHGGHHAGHHASHNHHPYHPSHHHAAHHAHHGDHQHKHRHYDHHHHGWHRGGWGPGFVGGAALGYGLGYGYNNWAGWGYDGDAGNTYVDNSTTINPASNETADSSDDTDDDSSNAAASTPNGVDGFATDDWPEIGIVTYAGQYGGSQGQVIVRVVPGSAAAKSGLVPGDVILTFNGKPVPSAVDLDTALDSAKGKFEMIVWDARTGRKSTVEGALDTAPQATDTASINSIQQ